MLKRKLFSIVVIGFLILLNSSVQSQTFGFGCLGFFGGYGGVVYQSYKAEGLNQFVKYFNENKFSTLNDPLQEYYGAVGYRVDLFLLQRVIINHYPEQGRQSKHYRMVQQTMNLNLTLKTGLSASISVMQ